MSEDFESKYTKQNFATRYLVNGFYRGLKEVLPKAPAILEVGCGAGYSTERISNFGTFQTLRAVELEPHLVEKARMRNPQVDITQANVYQLPFDDNSFDVILILEVLEHLTDPQMALKELSRVSRRWVVASVPREPLWCALNFARGKYWSSFGNTPGHIQHWSKGAFCSFLGQYGRVTSTRSPVPWTIATLELNKALAGS